MTIQRSLHDSLTTFGNRTAIENATHTISFAALQESSDAIAAFLQGQQLARQTIIGIYATDRIAIIQALLGIIKAGGVFVLLDPAWPVQRLQQALAQLGLQHVLVDTPAAGLPEAIHKYDLTTISATAHAGFQVPDYAADDSLYIYFTSGSTGEPKGIVGKNASLLQFLEWELHTFHLDEEVRVSQLISPYFDAFLRDVFIPLLSGGTICIPPQESGWLTSNNLISWLNDQQISLVHCVPSLFRLFNTEDVTPQHFAQLRYVLLSGERIIPAELEPWYRCFGDRIQLVNLYGATESTLVRTYYLIRSQDAGTARIPAGVPISDTELVLLSADGKPARKLMTGEIYIVSNYLSKGYYQNPELTAARFVTLPDGRPAFRTGDLGRILADGNLDLLGREDRQLKLNGIRIEPEEIEVVLQKSGLVKQALVVMRTDAKHNSSLVAFVTTVNPAMPLSQLEEALHQHAKEHLPTHMLPARIVALETFPLLTNGKIDQQALLARLETVQLVAPTSETEERLLAIWQGLLGSNAISTDATFQSLGGNSITIMRLVGRIYNEFKIRISLHELFNNLTIQKQALFIAQKEQDNLLVIARAPEQPSYPLSAAQERIYYAYTLHPDSKAYNLPMAWEIGPQYEKPELERVLQQLMQRHEGLRTRFVLENDVPVQVVQPQVDFWLPEIYTELDDIDSAIQAFVQPFNLAAGTLFRAAILTTPSARRFLVADMHHIICDGMSQNVLLADFAALHEGQPLTPLEVQYKDYAVWERQFRQLDAYLTNRQFWLQAFEKDVPPLPFAALLSEPATEEEAGGTIAFDVPKAALANLLEFMQEKSVSTFAGLFGLYSIFLSHLTGLDDVVIGTVSSGRVQKEVEGVVGMFVKTLPIRQHVEGSMPCASFITQLHRYLISAVNAQAYDLADIMQDLNKGRAKPIAQLFNTLFVFQNYGAARQPQATADIFVHQFENGYAKYPLTLYVEEGPDAFSFRWEYATQYFSRQRSEELVAQFTAMAARISEEIYAPIIELASLNAVALPLDDEAIDFNF